MTNSYGVARFNLRIPANNQNKETTMKVTITKQCMGDRNCNKLCPEVFEYDEDQLLSIVKLDPIPAHLEDVARRAARECGAEAIIIEE
jgi:ferredoxin